MSKRDHITEKGEDSMPIGITKKGFLSNNALKILAGRMVAGEDGSLTYYRLGDRDDQAAEEISA